MNFKDSFLLTMVIELKQIYQVIDMMIKEDLLALRVLERPH